MLREFLLAVIAAAAAGRDLGAQTQLGTYELRICRMECGWNDDSRLVTSGVLVLDRDLSDRSLMSSPRRLEAYERSRRYLVDEDGRGINGCFAIAPSAASAESFVGIITRGFTAWRIHDDGTLRLPLYQSPDASFDVTLAPFGSEWVGRGVSESYVSEVFGRSLPQEFVRIRRTGPAAPVRCFSDPEGFEDGAK